MIWQQAISGVIAPLAAALLFGAVVGWNRESHGKIAGLRTHMLVSMGAAVFVLAALQLSERTSGDQNVAVDTARIIEGVATGIGFLGAGTILKSKGKVEGVTTAASVWVTGAIGAACGAGIYTLAVAATVFALFVLWPAAKLKEEAMENHHD